ncbi:hypothetical protein CVU82_02960 [Candidatus Falkowbacteria bacterium HGW-Falkowbacteria-1]|jgi:putative ABC transport system permease protein|uniref:Multidrug ABC transporter substrate-binding protein n=1 Tax=Candidatus Falkowbacteria bacterium HGW-Falkowbacteria-1 TaxID=2013768 RepID=A0A2N2EA09_9BACT|nr:MAG: hypothetical protein CVU82_02960 [Candidatus Falkowbacteria bacterium HGW-Falkowbacteria-1]
MRIIEVAKLSLKLMLKNKMRTGLTVLGMLIGIASIVIVFSAGEGIRSLIIGQIESFGTNIVQTEIRVPNTKTGMQAETESARAVAGGAQITSMKERDLEDLKKIPNVIDGYGAVLGQETVSYANESKGRFLFGVSASYIEIDKSEIASGYFFSDDDDKSLSQVVVLGSNAAEDIFKDQDPINKIITIKKSKYKVVGVLKKKGANMGFSFDDAIILPIKTLQKKILGTDYYMYMVHQVENPNMAEETAQIMTDILRDNHNISDADKDDFRVTTMKEMLDTSKTITDGLTILLLLIVAISLLVGGVGILNVMYVIVSERTPEIGLRKAVGAKFDDIMRQFLTESVLITLIGAFLGMILGVAFSFLIYLGANYFGLDWKLVLPLKAFIVSIVFAIVFGIIFGIFPARKAAKLNPVDALRKE